MVSSRKVNSYTLVVGGTQLGTSFIRIKALLLRVQDKNGIYLLEIHINDRDRIEKRGLNEKFYVYIRVESL